MNKARAFLLAVARVLSPRGCEGGRASSDTVQAGCAGTWLATGAWPMQSIVLFEDGAGRAYRFRRFDRRDEPLYFLRWERGDGVVHISFASGEGETQTVSFSVSGAQLEALDGSGMRFERGE